MLGSTLQHQNPLRVDRLRAYWTNCRRASTREHERAVLNAHLECMFNEEFGDTGGTLEEILSVKYRKVEEIMDLSATVVSGHYQI